MKTLHVQGMSCQHFAGTVKKVLEDLGGESVQIDLAKGEAHFDGNLDLEAARKALSAKKFTLID